MSFNFIKSSLLGVSLLTPMILNAIPAKPGFIEALQPYGTTVTIRLTGDEWNHHAFTSDGYLLTTNREGFYVFADEKDGAIVPTSILASNPAFRTAGERAEIAKLNRERIIVKANQDSQTVGTRSPMRGPGRYTTTFPSEGEQKGVAILVEFPNKEFTINNPKEYYTRMLNEEGFADFGATGSVRDYFLQSSNGIFSPYFDVYGPVKLEKEYSYYGADDDSLAYEMIIDACTLLDDEIDFTQYDRNHDGIIDNVYVIYAGFGEADGGGADTIWPHSWDLIFCSFKRYFYDGVLLNHYACSNELQITRIPDGIGSFCHEFSHVLGLPDLYSTTFTGAFTPGDWSIMDIGSYNNGSRTPPLYSTYERYAVDWIVPELISEAGTYELEKLNESNHAYMILTEKENEFFLFENRQQEGNDLYIPGHGMLIWHIDINQEVFDENVVNDDADHQCVDLIEADNRLSEWNRDGDSFPGASNVTSFTSETTPAFLSWSNKPVGFDITDISESEDGIISFTVSSNPVSGIGEVNASTGFIISANSLTCLTNGLNVFNVAGQKVADMSYGESVELAAGVYILSNGKESYKIAIR